MNEVMIETPRGTFGARAHGNTGVPIVVLLHGFPDDASTFDGLGGQLAHHGYRALSVCLRGYAPSPLKGDLSLDGLVADLLAVIDAVSPDSPAFFIGHDYGAQIGYLAMTRAPERFARAVTLAGAHPAIINRNMKRLPRQWWMSRYIVFFQFGEFADRRVSADDFRFIDRLWKRWAPRFTPSVDHIKRVKETLRASMPAPIAMYRAGDFDVPAEPVQVPTLFIAGRNDGCLLPETASGQDRLFPRGYHACILDGVGHFPHLERPPETLAMVLEHFHRAAEGTTAFSD